MRRPRGHTAVMAQHAPSEVKEDTPLQALQRRLQLFPTPPPAARAGGELIMGLDPGQWGAEEPACGLGHMAYGLKDYFRTVATADIYDHGWDGQDRVQDFLSSDRRGWPEADWIITNPPFSLAQRFVETGLQRARRGVAVLCRQGWFDTEGRYRLFFGERSCDVKGAFFDRVDMRLGRWDPNGSTATVYHWYIWFTDAARPAWLRQVKAAMSNYAPAGFDGGPVEFGIPPGTLKRLTKPDDARLFATPAATPLFETPPT